MDRLLPLASQTAPNTDTITYEYDPVGNLLSLTDGENNETDYVYDNLNRLSSEAHLVALYDNGISVVTTTAITSYQYDAK
ncbi:MAG: RHS repeat protein [Planctomycetes bacterium]|nr:RHS repeat protein [Planctomycetota bacterium]